MIHQFRDKKQISRRKKINRLLLVFGVFIVLVFLFISPVSRKFSHNIGRPLWETKIFTLDIFSNLNYLLKNKSTLLKENINLKEENTNLKISMIDYQILKNENEKLKKLLGVIVAPADFILAGILVKPSQSPYDTLIIDVGESNGIKEGFKVYVNGNVPVGEIKEVYSKTSLVELYTNPSRVTTGVVEGLNVNIDLVGRGGGNFEMAIPFELVVPNESRIFFPGIESEIIAIVEEEIGEPTDPVKKVILRAPINIQNQKWVQVKKN